MVVDDSTYFASPRSLHDDNSPTLKSSPAAVIDASEPPPGGQSYSDSDFHHDESETLSSQASLSVKPSSGADLSPSRYSLPDSVMMGSDIRHHIAVLSTQLTTWQSKFQLAIDRLNRLEEETLFERESFEDSLLDADNELEDLARHVVSLETQLSSEAFENSRNLEEQASIVAGFDLLLNIDFSILVHFLSFLLLSFMREKENFFHLNMFVLPILNHFNYLSLTKRVAQALGQTEKSILEEVG